MPYSWELSPLRVSAFSFESDLLSFIFFGRESLRLKLLCRVLSHYRLEISGPPLWTDDLLKVRIHRFLQH